MAGRQLSITIMIILVDVLNDGNGLALTPRIRVYLPLMVEGNTFQESYKQTRDVSTRDDEDAPSYPSMHIGDSVAKES